MLVKTYRLRLYVLYLIPLVVMLGLSIRLYYLQIKDHARYQKLADQQHFDEYDIIPMRGKIFDSNGHEMAGSIILDKAHLNINRLPSDQELLLPDLAKGIAKIINNPAMKEDEILKRLYGKVNKWPFLARDISEEQKLELRKFLMSEDMQKAGAPSSLISFIPENKRRYTRSGLAPHIVGYTQRDDTGDNKGVAGVERVYNDELRGKEEKYTARKNAQGNPMEPADPELVESTFGHSVKLTIDESIQTVTQNVLAQGVEKSLSDAGVAICYSVKTGEILSLASYPTFNLNNIGGASPEQRRNRALTDAIEPGSVMKIITFTSLFDDKKAEPFDLINCEDGSWTMPSGRPIHDSHALGTVPVSQVFQYSSNIGTIKAARAFSDAEFYAHLKRFGFGERTGVDLPGESRGVLSNYKGWSGMSMSSLPMGYEIQLTAMQVVGAVGAIANKGMYMQPHIVKEILDHNGKTIKKIEPKFVRNVASPEACRKVVDLMELVVLNGTATGAQLDGYRVGGKTGTTKKYNPDTKRYYEKAYIASFCGVAPIEDPEVVIYVYVDNPRGSKVYGGQVAAPVFREIAREAMRVLRVPENRNTMPADDFKKTLETVRNKIDGRVPMEILTDFGSASTEGVTSGTVPDLLHMGMREAVEKAAAAGMKVRVSGSGIVVEQEPSPYETIEGEKTIHVTLANSSKFIARLVDTYEEDMVLEDSKTIADATGRGMVRPLTSLSLSLRSDGSSYKLPVIMPKTTELSGSSSSQTANRATNKLALPTLELDSLGELDSPGGRESAKILEQNLKDLEKRRSIKTRDPKELQSASKSTNNRESNLPIPAIDGTGDLDPTVTPIEPIDIETPVLPKNERDSSAGSLYDLM